MLTEICQELKNWFVRSSSDIHSGVYTIEDGALKGADFLLADQYYRIEGSTFNDGVHKAGDVLIDETFSGRVSAMAIPQAVADLAKEIEDWNGKYGAATVSPYQSESWGGYSYSKGGADNAAGTGGYGLTWQSTFAARLNRWRKA